jgi:nucleoid DNA-binding protein
MTVTKRDLVLQIAEALTREQKKLEKEHQQLAKSAAAKPGRRKAVRPALEQQQVFDVVQRTLDAISHALAGGNKVELRNFGIFEVRVRKARIGRNPNKPGSEVPIPARPVVKFKAGKIMNAEVLKLPVKSLAGAPKPAAQT